MSSHNLLQLMTHLNDFESTISNVVFEFATRLSTLIDSKLLIILENKEGRKLCGSRRLVEDYAHGNLRGADSDQLVHLKPSEGLDFSGVDETATYAPLDLSCEFGDEEEEAAAEAAAEDLKPPPSALKRKSKRQEAAVAAKRTRASLDEDFRSQDDEDDVCFVESVFPAPDEELDPGSGQMAVYSGGVGTDMDFGPPVSPEVVDAFSLNVRNLNLPFKKIEVLQTVGDPNIIFQRESVEFKLMNSILYDFGKELAYVCPHVDDGVKAKIFFHHNFKNFLSLFPSLKPELISKIRIAKKTAEAHLKNNARAGFNSVFDKKKKYNL